MIYVDEAEWPWRGKMWCHLMTDSEDFEELHEFAKKLGLVRGYFQSPPKVSTPHYDITASKRDKAIKLGAIPMDRAATSALAKKTRINWANRKL